MRYILAFLLALTFAVTSWAADSFTGIADGTTVMPIAQTGTYTVSGTWVATIELQRQQGASWVVVKTLTANVTALPIDSPGNYRFACTAYTSGTAVCTITPTAKVYQTQNNQAGTLVFKVDDNGVTSNLFSGPISGGPATFTTLTNTLGRITSLQAIVSAAGTTVLTVDKNYVVVTGTTTQTLTMPACASGVEIHIKNDSTGIVTVNRAGSNTIKGGTTVAMPAGSEMALVGNGTDWADFTNVLASNAETVTGTNTTKAVTPDDLTFRLAAPGTIGGTTPGAITGTTLTATGTTTASMTTPGGYTSTVATGTAPFTATSTTVCPNLNASALGGGTWASPVAIGTGTPAAGTFTTVAATAAGGITIGTDVAPGTPNIAGTIKLWSAGNNAFSTSFITGTQTADANYTLPTAIGAAGAALTDAAGNGVLSWVVPSGGGITGALTATRIPVASGASTLTDYATLTTDGTTLTIDGVPFGRAGAMGTGNVNVICIGAGAGRRAIGDSNTLIGRYAFPESTGSRNVIIGDQIMENAGPATSNNVMVGSNICWARPIFGAPTQCTLLGDGITMYSAVSNSSGLGYLVDITKSNQVVLGNASVTEVYIPGTTDATTPTAAQLYVAGGIGASRIRTTNPSYFDGALVGSAEITSPTAVFHPAAGSAASASAMSFGVSLAEGLQLKVIEETVTFTASKFINLTTAIPANAVILSVKSTTKTAITTGGTAVRISIGPTGTLDKYGKTAGLTQNEKITTMAAWSVNGGETIAVNITDTAGTTLSDTNATAGAVRVRIEYFLPVDLDN